VDILGRMIGESPCILHRILFREILKTLLDLFRQAFCGPTLSP
jgi:hypothetical protein